MLLEFEILKTLKHYSRTCYRLPWQSRSIIDYKLFRASSQFLNQLILKALKRHRLVFYRNLDDNCLGSGLTPAFCRLVSPQALPILENDKPVSPTAKSTSPTGLVPTAYSRAGTVDRLGRKDRRVQSSRVTESYNRPYVSSSSTSSYTGRSASGKYW